MTTISNLLGFKDKKKIDYDFNSYSKKSFNVLGFKSKTEELDCRYANLKDVIETFNKYDICYWLYGKTLLGMYRDGKLIESDHDEDIGVNIGDMKKVCTDIYPDLVKKGFYVIRATENSMLTIMRNNRYLDICFFRDCGKGLVGYEQKRVPKEFLETIIEKEINGFVYKVPERSQQLLRYVYHN